MTRQLLIFAVYANELTRTSGFYQRQDILLSSSSVIYIQLVLTQAPMDTPHKSEFGPENLYQIPSCTICLVELNNDMASLDCGHIFHLGCISQHFQYRGTCPNCQKRACLKEVRTIHYQLTQNSKANARLHSLISSMDLSQRKQMEQMIKQIKGEAEKNQKLKADIGQVEKQKKKWKDEYEKTREQLKLGRKDLEDMRVQNLKLTNSNDLLTQDVNRMEKNQVSNQIRLQKYEKQQKQFEKMLKLKEMMRYNAEELMTEKMVMESKNQPEEMAKLWYDMLMLKNLELRKKREQIDDYTLQLKDREVDINRLKSQMDAIRRSTKQANQKRTQERKRYDDLKVKHRALIEQAKKHGMKSNEIPDIDENSQNNSFQPPVPVPILAPVPVEIMVPQTVHRPVFKTNSVSKIGGFNFKKKDSTSYFG